MCAKFSFLPLLIFYSYVSFVQKTIRFCTLRRISNLSNLAVASWDISCFLSLGLYGRVVCARSA